MSQIDGPICHPKGIRGYGDPSYGVVLVGIAPGRDEALKTKRPFTGQSGKLLDATLRAVGWPREKVYATNTICWWNDAPTAEEIAGCKPRFEAELAEFQPRIIVPVGTIAASVFLPQPKGKKRSYRGSVLWDANRKAYILTTHHPAAVLHSQSLSFMTDIIKDLSKIEMVLNWPMDGSIANVTHRVVESAEEAIATLRALPTDRPVILDIETSTPETDEMDVFQDRLLCVGLSWNDDLGVEHNVVIPAAQAPSAEYWPVGPNGPRWTFQNGQYDTLGMSRYIEGLPFMRINDDTMLMSYILDERPGQHSLKNLAREYCGAGWYEEEIKPFYKGKLHLLPPEKVYEYNAKDVAYTARVFPILKRKMEADGVDGVYRRLLIPAANTFRNMQARGIAIDFDVLQDLAADWNDRATAMEAEMQADAQELGWPESDLINIRSTQQLGKLFYRIIGLDIIKHTKKGAPSLDKEVMEKLQHPFADRIREFRTLDGMLDYVISILQNMKSDGLIHPSALLHNTRTGRTAYHDPAMQTIPKDYTVGADYARIREVFIPRVMKCRFCGRVNSRLIFEADYNQIEVWIGWAYSKDPVLLEHLKTGDVHSATAEGAFKVLRTDFTEDEWKKKRQNAKKIRFGLMYGEGATKLGSPPPVGIGCTTWEAQQFIDNYWKTYPTYRAWTLTMERAAMDAGEIVSASGRKMRFPIVLDHKQLRQAINFPIQSTASDYALESMIELEPVLDELEAYILLNVHDSLVVEGCECKSEAVISAMRYYMEKPKYEGFPSVKIDLKVGRSLGTVEKVK